MSILLLLLRSLVLLRIDSSDSTFLLWLLFGNC
jgi:hypothetical protein